MPLLRRSHGRHRDLPGYPSAPRPAVFALLTRENGVVTRRDEPHAAAEAIPLRPSGAHVPRSADSSTSVPMIAKSASPPLWHRPARRPTERSLSSPPPASTGSHSPRHPHHETQILKSP